MTEERDTLKACPFCGEAAEEGSDDKYGSFVFCTDEETCNALQHNFDTEEHAIAAWNTRATDTLTDSGADVERVTPEMIEAGRRVYHEQNQFRIISERVREIYLAMRIAALRSTPNEQATAE